MCPVCMATAALMVAGVVSTGGVTAFAAKWLRSKETLKQTSFEEPKRQESKQKEK